MTVGYPLVNGNAYGFSSIELDFGGVKSRGYKEVKYSSNLEPGELRGTHPQMLARTLGQYKAEGSLVLWTHEWNQLRDRMGQGYMQKTFTLNVVYAEAGPLGAQRDTLVGCRITKVEKGGSEGTDGLEVSLTLSVMKILENGIDPLSNPLV